MNGVYHAVVLNKIKLIEACSDVEIYNWADLSRKASLAPGVIAHAFRINNGRVSIDTAAKISRVLGKKIESFGKIQICVSNVQEMSDFAKVVKEKKERQDTLENPATAVCECKTRKGNLIEDKDRTGSYLPQLQPILREIKRSNELLEKLLAIWEK